MLLIRIKNYINIFNKNLIKIKIIIIYYKVFNFDKFCISGGILKIPFASRSLLYIQFK